MTQRFKGIYTPLTTPFKGGQISPEKFKENIRRYNAFDLSGYLVIGSTGESVYLSDIESEELVSAAVEAAEPGKTVIVGTARESTQLTLDFTNRAADLGADAALVRTPSYLKSLMDEQALKTHFFTLADKAKIPIIPYHIPRNTGLSISPRLVADLSQHPNIAGIKDSSGNLAFLGETIPLLHAEFDYLLGAAGVLLPGLILGASGGIITLSSLATTHCLKLYGLFLEKKWEEAVPLQHKLIPLNKAIIETYGIPAVKYALDRLGFNGGPCRPPLPSLGKEAQVHMDEILEKLKLI